MPGQDRQTDRRTPYRYIDPAPHAMRAVLINRQPAHRRQKSSVRRSVYDVPDGVITVQGSVARRTSAGTGQQADT